MRMVWNSVYRTPHEDRSSILAISAMRYRDSDDQQQYQAARGGIERWSVDVATAATRIFACDLKLKRPILFF